MLNVPYFMMLPKGAIGVHGPEQILSNNHKSRKV